MPARLIALAAALLALLLPALGHAQEVDCANGVDDDSDSLIDCLDSDCVLVTACENEDFDGDGVNNGVDTNPTLMFVCGDSDNDTCEDCLFGSSAPNNDGRKNTGPRKVLSTAVSTGSSRPSPSSFASFVTSAMSVMINDGLAGVSTYSIRTRSGPSSCAAWRIRAAASFPPGTKRVSMPIRGRMCSNR